MTVIYVMTELAGDQDRFDELCDTSVVKDWDDCPRLLDHYMMINDILGDSQLIVKPARTLTNWGMFDAFNEERGEEYDGVWLDLIRGEHVLEKWFLEDSLQIDYDTPRLSLSPPGRFAIRRPR